MFLQAKRPSTQMCHCIKNCSTCRHLKASYLISTPAERHLSAFCSYFVVFCHAALLYFSLPQY